MKDKTNMTLNEAFDMLQAIGPARAVEKWGTDGMKSDSLVHACSITLSGLKIEPLEDRDKTAEIMAHMLWLVAIAFEAGRIYEGGTPA
jgi:hypothetical protein